MNDALATADPAHRTLSDLLHEHARARPEQAALVQGDTTLSYAALDALMDRIAASAPASRSMPG